MLRHLIQAHSELEQGETIKIIYTTPDYNTYVNRTDKICNDGRILRVERANGARVYINPRQIVFFCIIKEMW